MDKVSGRLTVFFEEPFWIGVFERISEGKLSVCKVTFGAEPKDYEVYDFVLRNYYRLKFSPAVATDVKEASRNPKRGATHWGLTPMLLSNRTMVSGLQFTTGVSFPLKIMNVVNK